MSERGMCSRREADEYIARGWVYVDGQRVQELGTRAAPTARITLDKRTAAIHKVTILVNKPMGYVSGQAESGYRPAIALVTPGNHYAQDSSKTRLVRQHLKGLAPAGRLDIDSTGLLVLTQDGRIAKRLIGRDSAIEKEYLVRVQGNLSDKDMRLLNHGLKLDGNGDGTGGDNAVEAFFRIYGDSTGDGAVGIPDFIHFRDSYNNQTLLDIFDIELEDGLVCCGLSEVDVEYFGGARDGMHGSRVH